MGYTVYKLANGTRVPSVTTIIKLLGLNTEGLIRWAHGVGLEGQDLDHARKGAASIGTIAHAMIEAYLDGTDVDLRGVPAEVVNGARIAFESWREWAELTGYRVVTKELPLVSEKHRFGGTSDVVLVKGRRVLADWKTSSGIYAEHLIQVAAYGALWDEANPTEPIEGYALLRLGKHEPLFDYHFRPAGGPAMRSAWQAFLHLRELYDLTRDLKRAA